MIFFRGKGNSISPLIIHKKNFHIGQVPIRIRIKNFVSAIQHIGYRKKFLEVLSPIDQANPFTYSCKLTLQTSYKNGMLGQRGEAVKMLKNKIIIKAHSVIMIKTNFL